MLNILILSRIFIRRFTTDCNQIKESNTVVHVYWGTEGIMRLKKNEILQKLYLEFEKKKSP